MKAQILTINGEKKGEIELPKFFEDPVRKDLIKRAYEVELASKRHPYGTNPRAGKEVSAAGKLHRARHQWKGSYGYGISRVPRKIMTKRGNRFSWVGAFSPNTRGGRAAHPPKAWKVWKIKINKKEKMMAIKSILASSISKEIATKYKIQLPIIIEDRIMDIKKTKEMKKILEKICPETSRVVLISDKKIKTGITNVDVKNISILDLAPSGTPDRVIIFTENSIRELGKLK
jgi:large subunit ribosomal protein L4e